MTSTRVALVTGSAGGIGRAIAEALALAGYSVRGVDVRTVDGQVSFDQDLLDLSDPAAIEDYVTRRGGVDVLVNNASVLVDRPLEEMTLLDMQLLFDINLRAPVLLTRGVLPHMRANCWGRVINLSSVGARTGGMSNSAVYNMTKAGIASFTRFVARHDGPFGVTANAIAPGGIETGMTAHLSAAQREAIVSQIPVGRMASPDEVAGAAVYLASDAAGFVNGVTLDVNGGWVMV